MTLFRALFVTHSPWRRATGLKRVDGYPRHRWKAIKQRFCSATLSTKWKVWIMVFDDLQHIISDNIWKAVLEETIGSNVDKYFCSRQSWQARRIKDAQPLQLPHCDCVISPAEDGRTNRQASLGWGEQNFTDILKLAKQNRSMATEATFVQEKTAY